MNQRTRVVKHVHLEIRFVDKTFVARRTFDFSFRLMIANGVELQRALSFEELIANGAHVRLFCRVRVLKRIKVSPSTRPRTWKSSNRLPNVFEGSKTWKSNDDKLHTQTVSRQCAIAGAG